MKQKKTGELSVYYSVVMKMEVRGGNLRFFKKKEGKSINQSKIPNLTLSLLQSSKISRKIYILLRTRK
jgi:hypothetical protein